MNDDFDKKLNIIFERIESVIQANREKKFDIMLKRTESFASVAIALMTLIISFFTFNVYKNTYSLTEEQFLLNTTENLALSVGSSDVDIVDLKTGGEEPELYYKVKLSVCIINKSNLPTSIIDINASRSGYGNDIRLFPTIHEVDLPISMQPQETMFLDCYMQVKIPDFINEFIVEKFPDISHTDFDTITKYLFFEKRTDLIGNEVIVEEKDGATNFKQHLTLPFSLRLSTSKGNDFSTKFYEGGTEFFLDKEHMDNLAEQYGSWGIEFSKEPIVDDSGKNYMSFWSFIKNDPSSLLLIIIPTAVFALVHVGFLYLFEIRKTKLKATITQDQKSNLQAEQDNATTDDKTD